MDSFVVEQFSLFLSSMVSSQLERNSVCVCYIIMDMGLYGRFMETELGELLRDYETLRV